VSLLKLKNYNSRSYYLSDYVVEGIKLYCKQRGFDSLSETVEKILDDFLLENLVMEAVPQ